jgi:two-component system sensor kinase FixL
MLIPYDDHLSQRTALAPCEAKSTQAVFSGTERMQADIAPQGRSSGRRLSESLRDFGHDAVGVVRWGAHVCQFYATEEELLDVVAPYIAAGLAANEVCVWIVSAPLRVADAEARLARIAPDLEARRAAGQIEIIVGEDWYLAGGAFDSERVLRGWTEKIETARRRGFEGLRLTGNSVEPRHEDEWRAFADYETALGRLLESTPTLALCCYSLAHCDAAKILDVIARHQLALVRRGDRWETVTSLDHERTRQALRESEERFRLLVDSAPNSALIILDREGRVARWNEAAARVTGWAEAEAIGRPLSMFLPPSSRRQPSRRALERAAATGVFTDEGERQRKDGARFHAEVAISPLHDDLGRICGYAKLIRDVSERRRIEKARLASEARLLAIVEGAVDAIVTVDSCGAVQSLNSAAQRLFGYDAAETVGRDVALLIPEPTGGARAVSVTEWLRGGAESIIGREVVGLRKDGATLPLELTVSEATHDGERLFVAFLRDLTEKRRAEAHLRKLRVDRMDLMAQMAAGVAHEINQPLSAIATYLSAARRMLQRRGAPSGAMVEPILDSAVEQVMRAAQIIGHLRGFVTHAEPDKTLQSLHGLIREACATTQADAENVRVDVSLDLAAERDLVIADRLQIRQALVNLKRNAIEAMHGAEERRLVVSTRLVDDRMIRVDIADTGAGLSEEEAKILFEPFITTKTHGLGVGLSVSHSIVEAHYGKLWAESNPGGGAILSFTLPLADALCEEELHEA